MISAHGKDVVAYVKVKFAIGMAYHAQSFRHISENLKLGDEGYRNVGHPCMLPHHQWQPNGNAIMQGVCVAISFSLV